MDEGMSHEDANKAADRLMKHLFNVKTNKWLYKCCPSSLERF
jgi:hypothetical protein